MAKNPLANNRDVRGMLTQLGLGQWTINGIIPSVFMAAGTTDPASPPIGALVSAIQKKCGIPQTGMIDDGTAYVLTNDVGIPNWERSAWFDIVRAVLSYNRAVPNYRAPSSADGIGYYVSKDSKLETALGDYLDAPFGLPDVPGGLLTYAIGGYFLYKWFTNRKKAA